MKYFEIVFDSSASMSNAIAGSTRIEVAKKLFLSEVLPNIDQNTQLAVRLLRDSCSGHSQYTFVGSNLNDCIAFINSIQAIGSSTPLFNTMKDALQTTLQQQASEKTIFVLTDGGDTCGNAIENVLTAEEMKWFKQINVILAQFTVSGASEVNQLSHFANTIGARTFNFGTNPNAGINAIRSELKVELQKAGLSRNGKLSHCFEDLAGDSMKWEHIESSGYSFHQAMVLYQEDCLSWMPDLSKNVNPTQFAELKFLYGIRFASGISSAVMKAMLDQLQKPYYYSSNCIYWHFEEARWKYFPQPAPIVVEKEVEKIVYQNRIHDGEIFKVYKEGRYYEVCMLDEYDDSQLNPYKNFNPQTYGEFTLREAELYKPAKTLKHGDLVTFTKRLRGRPKKK
jgi:hypothetical protein